MCPSLSVRRPSLIITGVAILNYLLGCVCLLAAGSRPASAQPPPRTWTVGSYSTGRTDGTAHIGPGSWGSFTPSNNSIAQEVSTVAGMDGSSGSGDANIDTSWGKIVYVIKWNPKNNDWNLDPA